MPKFINPTNVITGPDARWSYANIWEGKLRPYATYVDSGLFEMKEFVNDKTGYTDTQTMITPKGKETFRLLCI